MGEVVRSEVDIQAATARMRKLVGHPDWEVTHGEADDILCEVLRALGYTDLVDAFDEVGKWYA